MNAIITVAQRAFTHFRQLFGQVLQSFSVFDPKASPVRPALTYAIDTIFSVGREGQ